MKALAAEPRFVKALLRLADLYVYSPLATPDGLRRAEAILARVIEVHPNCQQAPKLFADLATKRTKFVTS